MYYFVVSSKGKDPSQYFFYFFCTHPSQYLPFIKILSYFLKLIFCFRAIKDCFPVGENSTTITLMGDSRSVERLFNWLKYKKCGVYLEWNTFLGIWIMLQFLFFTYMTIFMFLISFLAETISILLIWFLSYLS